eukprot:g10573.t1 g10573   contig4:2129344-2130038(-)
MSSLINRPVSILGSIAARRLRLVPPPSLLCKTTNNNQRCSVPLSQHTNRHNLVCHFSAETVTITYVDPDGEEHPVKAEVGKNLLDVAHENNIELEGACGGELACSTCHLVFDRDVFDTLPPKSDEEEDMLDLAFELTDTSRLGCQICVTKEFEGIKVRIPDDGY